MRMTRQNKILTALVAVVVGVAVVAAVVSATRQAPDYDPASPEGVVQRYLAAVLEGDLAAAAARLEPDSRCTVEDLDRAYVPDGVRAVLRGAEVDGQKAVVKVDLAVSSGGLFDGSEFTDDQTFRLSRSGDGWRIAGSPWPLDSCELER